MSFEVIMYYFDNQAVYVFGWKAKGRCFDSGGDLYYSLEIFARLPSLQLGRANANEINHDHLIVVIVVLDNRND